MPTTHFRFLRRFGTVAAAIIVVLMAGNASAIPYDPEAPCESGGDYSCPAGPAKPNRVVYLHGRSMVTWPCQAKLGGPAANNWQHRIMSYNGDVRLANWAARGPINDELQISCNAPNQCVIMCFSAGCARLLVALDDLKAVNATPSRILWIQAAGSAAGGSEIAQATTGGGLATVYAKLTGSSAPIDEDLWPSRMRSNLGYIQNRAPVAMYHVAGSKNMCKNFYFHPVNSFFPAKICGNGFLPGNYGDGAVPMHSACGFSASGAFNDCNFPHAKYTNRFTAASGSYYNTHTSILGPAVQNASVRLALSPYLPSIAEFPEPPVGGRECLRTNPECDQPSWRDQLSCIMKVRSPSTAVVKTGDTWPGGTGGSGWTPGAEKY